LLALIITILIIIAGSIFISTLYTYDRHSLLYYGDAVSHLFGSRRLVDWEYPGLQQLGTVWLPLPKFLFLLPSLVDVLFFTGLAGSIVNLSAIALTTYIIYSMLRLRKNYAKDDSSKMSLLLALSLLYPLNLNILYLGVVAMTEACFMLFFTASAFYLYRFMLNTRYNNILLCSLFIALATLTRYEGWILVAFLLVYLLAVIIRKRSRDGVKDRLSVIDGNNASSKDNNYSVSQSQTTLRPIPLLISLLIASSGILSWLLYNYYTYGDALEFANAQYYSAAWQALHREYREELFLQPLNVISVYGINAAIFYGPLLSYALISSLLHRERCMIMLYLYLALPAVFTIASMIIGVGEMDFWFNSRFVVLIAPLLILLTADWFNGRFNISANTTAKTLLILAFVYQLILIPLLHYNSVAGSNYIIIISELKQYISTLTNKDSVGIITYLDAKDGYTQGKTLASIRVGEFLKENYAFSNLKIMIITGSMQEHRIILSSWIRLSMYDEIIEASTWKDSFKRPWLYDDIIVISKYPDSDAVNVSKYWLDRLDKLYRYYKNVYEDEYFIVLQSKGFNKLN
jgi:hypothetical protein